jgi:hypothetical protein
MQQWMLFAAKRLPAARVVRFRHEQRAPPVALETVALDANRIEPFGA